MSLGEHFDTCDHCGGYRIYGTYRSTARGLSSMCRCDDVALDRLTVTQSDPLRDIAPDNGRPRWAA